ncbi:MAG: FecR domain-containing protein [Phenylobacterium sp.]|uniref:FecR family protein n=1 Tax=Phenylobacterium sp. TaxID=1871053 RepID=UPI001A4CC615|nr:FecR family protein [Phenylobacterium sp.]MBL8553463.1 FecR domain-containing protein [Phenylobacterium sp.]
MREAWLAGLLMAAALSTPGMAWAEIGRIKTVVGSASVVRGKAVTPAAPGVLLQVSDVLQTGKDGRIGLTFIDNSRFSVGPNSRVALTQFEFDDTTHKGSSLTTIDRGSLGVVSGQIAKENKDAMRVRTPTSLLAARGTKFVVEVKQ